LPELVRQMDRAYTAAFFGWPPQRLQGHEAGFFLLAFPVFANIAERVQPEHCVSDGWDSSTTKVVDNAVAGYYKRHGLDDVSSHRALVARAKEMGIYRQIVADTSSAGVCHNCVSMSQSHIRRIDMRFKHVLTALALAVLLYGCTVRSLNPLYTEKDVVLDTGLLGTWTEPSDADNNVTIQRYGPSGYRLVFSEGGKPLEGRLVKLDRYLFLDVTTKDGDDVFSIPAHLFVKIDLKGNTMRTALLNPDWAEKAADLKTLGLSHIRIGGKVVLTAPTKELQDFAVRYAGDESVFTRSKDHGAKEYRRTAIEVGK
jgi:hypothetical protein